MSSKDTLEIVICSTRSLNGQLSIFELHRPDSMLASFPHRNHTGFPTHASVHFLPQKMVLLASPFEDKSVINALDIKSVRACVPVCGVRIHSPECFCVASLCNHSLPSVSQMLPHI